MARVAIVTGGLSGIGLAAAQALAVAGCRVAVCSRRGADSGHTAAARAALGPDALIGAADVADPHSVDGFVDDVRGRLGPPLILVNAAGLYREAFLGDHPESDWLEQIDVNLNGTFRMIRAVYPDMVSAHWGRIANIASTAGTRGAAGYAGYCASKAGVIGLSKAVAVEGAPHGISCISISPTWIETPMMDKAVRRMSQVTGKSAAEMRETLRQSNPQGRLVPPQEVAALVAFFCSDAAPALTNVDVQVNAGADW